MQGNLTSGFQGSYLEPEQLIDKSLVEWASHMKEVVLSKEADDTVGVAGAEGIAAPNPIADPFAFDVSAFGDASGSDYGQPAGNKGTEADPFAFDMGAFEESQPPAATDPFAFDMGAFENPLVSGSDGPQSSPTQPPQQPAGDPSAFHSSASEDSAALRPAEPRPAAATSQQDPFAFSMSAFEDPPTLGGQVLQQGVANPTQGLKPGHPEAEQPKSLKAALKAAAKQQQPSALRKAVRIDSLGADELDDLRRLLNFERTSEGNSGEETRDAADGVFGKGQGAREAAGLVLRFAEALGSSSTNSLAGATNLDAAAQLSAAAMQVMVEIPEAG